MKCEVIADILEEQYPKECAEEWDNPGLLVGRGSAEVERIFVALDVTEEAILQAEQFGAQLIVAHHPVIFGGNWAPEKPPIMYRDMDSAKFRDFEGLAVESGFLSLTIRGYFIRYFFGLDVGLPEEEEITAMMARPEYLAMPVYPAQGCIRQIDDVWVVRLAPN